jgi:hypothetical protein
LRIGDSSWFRLTELWTATAKSVFLFDVRGSVAKSTHAGIPWLRYIRRNAKGNVHFWPFDGWAIPPGKSILLFGCAASPKKTETMINMLRMRHPPGSVELI